MPDTRTTYLEKHGRKWRVIVHVPAAVQRKIGKAHLKESLDTDNLATANLLKSAVVDRFKAIIEEALREVQPGDYHEEAKAIRAAKRLAPASGLSVQIFPRPGEEYEEEAEADSAGNIETIAEGLSRSHGDTVARSFSDAAHGRATPLKEHLQAFKDDHDYQAKSLLEMEGAFKRLGEWLASTKRSPNLEGITSDVASIYMRHLVHGLGISSQTASKYASFFRSYWKWLALKGHVKDGTVWAAPVPKGKAVRRHDDVEPDEGKRPFTTAEMKRLLGNATGDMLTLIKIAALTGMRIEEVYGLRVRDVVDGFLVVRVGKTANAKRRVPIHTDLKGTVEALGKDKKPGDYLFDPEAQVVEKTGLRSGAASKRFGTYRRGLGLDERPNKKPKSNIDFHSLRRWFIKEARNALLAGATGYNPWTIADVVGHEDDDLKDTLRMTLGLYPGASPDDALRACVAAVKLPTAEVIQ